MTGQPVEGIQLKGVDRLVTAYLIQANLNGAPTIAPDTTGRRPLDLTVGA